jgi:hypothetical protein
MPCGVTQRGNSAARCKAAREGSLNRGTQGSMDDTQQLILTPDSRTLSAELMGRSQRHEAPRRGGGNTRKDTRPPTSSAGCSTFLPSAEATSPSLGALSCGAASQRGKHASQLKKSSAPPAPRAGGNRGRAPSSQLQARPRRVWERSLSALPLSTLLNAPLGLSALE